MNRYFILHLLTAALITLFAWRIWHDSLKNHKNTQLASQSDQPRKTLIVGTNTEYPPFSFIDDDCIVGFDIDVADEVSKRLGKKMVLKNMSFNALIPEIQLGTIHMIAAGMTPTPERAKRVLFTEPHLAAHENPLVMVSLADNPIENIDELNNKTVVVNMGYAADVYASTLEGVHIVRLSSALVTQGLLALDSHHANVFITAHNAIEPLLKQMETNKYHSVPIPSIGESSALAISKKYPRLLLKVQDALNQMHADGTLEKLKKKWNLI